ncbi:DegV family protein [Chloroflexota bacterium]
MTVKIVTDGSSDIPPDLAKELNITVVPLTVVFGDKAYLDGVDITADEFYTRIVDTPVWPTTASPSIGQFTQVYNRLADETDEIVAILLSAKFSPCYQYGVAARDMVNSKCRVEVVDSTFGASPLGLLVITAAKAAKSGASMDEVIDIVKRTIPKTHILFFFDTLKYLEKGGRIGKAKALMGALLRAKPLLAIKDGESYPVGRVRSHREGLERLYKFATEFGNIAEMAIEHTNIPEEAKNLANRIGAVFPKGKIYMSRISPVVGAHLGPYAIGVSVIEA